MKLARAVGMMLANLAEMLPVTLGWVVADLVFPWATKFALASGCASSLWCLFYVGMGDHLLSGEASFSTDTNTGDHLVW